MISSPLQGVHDMGISRVETRCAGCGGLPTSWRCDPIIQGVPPYYAAACLEAGCDATASAVCAGTREKALERWALRQVGQ